MIIGISGKIGSGKDTVGKIIQYLTSIDYTKKHLGNKNDNADTYKKYHENWNNVGNWEVKKFADKLKDIVCLLINCTREQLENREFKEKELGEEWESTKLRNPYNNKTIIISQITHEEIDLMLGTKYLGYISDGNIKLTPRLLLQLIGTNLFREQLHPNIWVNSLMNEYKTCEYKCLKAGTSYCGDNKYDCTEVPNWIITDTRFPNELEAIKKRGGISIRVNRLSESLYLYDDSKLTLKQLFEIIYKDTGEYPLKDYADKHWLIRDTHPSETALDNAEFDYTIDNNGTIEDLIIKVKDILIKEKII